MEREKRKWYENGISALFMGPVEEHGRQLGQPAHARLYLNTHEDAQ